MTTSPEPLIDFTSGSEEEEGIKGKSGSGTSHRPPGRPPPPPPSSAKPKLITRSKTAGAIELGRRPAPVTPQKPILPPSSKKPTLPPKPKSRHSEVILNPPEDLNRLNVKTTPPPSNKTVRPLPPPKPGPQLTVVRPSPQRSPRASDSPISPVPDNGDLVIIRQTPTSESNDRQLQINGEGLLIDLTPSSNLDSEHAKVSKSYSSASEGKSTSISRKTQPICLPRLSTREFEYEEKEHPKNVFKQLNTLRQREDLCDVVLIAGDQEIRAHKVVLSANSPYFQDMFIGEFAEPDGAPIGIDEVDEESLMALVDFAYTSRIKLTQSNVYKLFEAADLLQFQGVKNACFRFFKSQMNKSNCIRTWIFAESHNCTELLEASLKFIEVNFLDIIRENEFLLIEPETVSRIVSLEDIAITCEEQVYDAVMGWLNHDIEERRQHALKVLQNVRFPSMNKEYLMHIVDNEPVIRDDPECLNLLIQALESHVSSERATLQRKAKKEGSKYLPRAASMAVEEVELPKGETSLGVAIMGGSDRPTHVFRQGDKPGIFIREVIPGGAAAKTGKLRAGDRILSINGQDVSSCPHDTAIRMLLSSKESLKLLVRHEPPPKGLKEITLVTKPGCGFGFSIGGGVNSEPVNPFDETDEGIFVTQVIPGGTAEQDGRLAVGMRILQVNSISLLGKTQDDALKILHEVLDRMALLICNGFDPSSSPPGYSDSGSITSWGEGVMIRDDQLHPKDWDHIYDQPPS